MSPRILTIQTACPAASLALTSGKRLLAELNLDIRETPSGWLLQEIDHLLLHANIKKQELDAIAVVNGPGSFTGLRVGLATAKGLAQSLDRPLIAISTLRCLAMQLPFAGFPVCVMHDARKQEVYTALFRWENGYPIAISEEMVVDPSDVLEQISGEVVFVGSGATLYRTLITRRFGERAHFAPFHLNVPRASSAAYLALLDWENGNVLSVYELMPNYLRPSEAELNQDKKKQGKSY